MFKTKIKNKGFTLAELLMAVWVMSIILAAIAALSFALGSVNDSVDDTSDIQSRIRYATMSLGELIKNSKLIYAQSADTITLWRADDDNDIQIDPNEIAYIEYDDNENSLKLNSTVLIDNCSYVTFTTDQLPPFTKKLNIFFGVNNNGIIENYQISDYLRCQADYLLDSSGQIVSSDDDM